MCAVGYSIRGICVIKHHLKRHILASKAYTCLSAEFPKHLLCRTECYDEIDDVMLVLTVTFFEWVGATKELAIPCR